MRMVRPEHKGVYEIAAAVRWLYRMIGFREMKITRSVTFNVGGWIRFLVLPKVVDNVRFMTIVKKYKK